MTFPCILLLLLVPSNAFLFRRDSSNNAQTLFIPVTNQNGVYSVQVNMSSGTPQPFSFTFSTSTGYSIVAGTSCTSCGAGTLYNQSASSSAVADNGAQGQFSTSGGTASGSLIREDCFLHETNGSSWSYPNQTIVVADQSQGLFSSGISGVVGLGTNSRDGNFDATIYGGFFRRRPTATNFTFGMALNPPSQSSTDGGQIHWLAPDPSAYTGNVSWKPMLPASAVSSSSDNSSSSNSSSVAADWYLQMDGFSFTSNSETTSLSGNLPTILDPSLGSTIFPQAQANSIYATVPGATVFGQTGVSNIFSVPCNSQMSMTLMFGQVSVPLDEGALIQNLQNGTCVGTIQSAMLLTDNQYLLGADIVSQIYVIFSVSNNQTGTVGIAQRSPASTIPSSDGSLKTLAIVGITLGSVAFVAVFAVGGICLLRMNRQRRLKQKTEHIRPFPSTIRESSGLLSGASGYSSPSWVGLRSATSQEFTQENDATSYLNPRAAPTTHSQTTTIYLSSEAEGSTESPPPYVITQWPRALPAVPLRQPPSDRKTRPLIDT